MILDNGMSSSVVCDFCFCNYVEGLDVHHDFTDTFTDVSGLNTYVTK